MHHNEVIISIMKSNFIMINQIYDITSNLNVIIEVQYDSRKKTSCD